MTSKKKYCHVCGKLTEHAGNRCREHNWKRKTDRLLEKLRRVIEEEKTDGPKAR